MKLSKPTLATLKNFANISSNLLITPGSVLKTRSVQNTIFATTTIADEFPIEFPIYELNEFLGVISLFSNPELEFNEKGQYVKIFEGQNSIKYFAADKSVISYPTKDIKFPEPEISFKLSADNLAQIQKTSSVLRAPDISFVGTDGKLLLVVSDKKNATSNAFEVAFGETEFTFKINIKVELLKLASTDYTVYVSSKKVAKFDADDSDLEYFLGVENDSVFE
jgi:gp45 sliding clamp, C terminal/DNA polymerase processivity factor